MSAPPSTLRLRLRHAGYDPIPDKGKEPHVDDWPNLVKVSDADICKWDSRYPDHSNTGINGRRTVGLDIDLLNEKAADAVEALAHEHFEKHGTILLRIGKAPKRLIPLRADEPFGKKLRVFVPPNAVLPIAQKDCHRIEVLADGEQWIAYGIHPDTGQPYRWPHGELTKTPREKLPHVSAEDMERFLADAALLLVTEFGYSPWTEPPTNGGGAQRQRKTDSRLGELNERAISNLDKWVPRLFPTAKRTKAGGYRVPSADLGRGFQEDLSLHPSGIKYFGVHDMGDARGGRRTAIDTVMEWNHLDLLDAARWLERTLNGGGGDPRPQPKPQPEPEPERQPTPKPQPKPEPKKYRFMLRPFDSISVSTKPNYLVKGFLPRTGIVVVWGPPKDGKSFWTFDLVMHIALGWEYRGHRVQQGTAVYIALEGGKGFEARIDAWRQRHLAEDHELVPFHLIDVSLDLIADRDALIADIRAQLGNEVPAVVTIDTLNRSLVGSENKDEDMGAYIKAADAIREAFGCLVIIVHHCGTAGNRPRGHTSLAGADDAQIAIERNQDGIIIATVEHAKDFEAGARVACKLEPVELGLDDEGDRLSLCIVVPTETPDAGPKLSKTNGLAFSLLKRLLTDQGETPPAKLNLAAGRRVVKTLAWREAFYAAHPSDKLGTKQKAFVRAHLDLFEQGLIAFHNEFVSAGPDKPDKSVF